MPTTPLTSGQSGNFVKEYPALATKVAMRTLKRAGITNITPDVALQMTQTDEFKTQAARMIDQGGETNFLKEFSSSVPDLPDTSIPVDQQSLDIYDKQESEALLRARANNILTSRILDATVKANELAEFNKTAYKTERLKELNPTRDIDNQILKIRMRQLREEADIRSNPRFSHLSPAAKERMINQNRSSTSDTISSLRDLRDARLSSAESRIDEEIDSRNEQIAKAKNAVANLEAAEKALKGREDSVDALFKIRQEKLKFQKTLQKARGKNGETSTVETITNAIIKEFLNLDFGAPTQQQEDTAKRLAEEIAKKIEASKGKGIPEEDLQRYIQSQAQAIAPRLQEGGQESGGGFFDFLR